MKDYIWYGLIINYKYLQPKIVFYAQPIPSDVNVPWENWKAYNRKLLTLQGVWALEEIELEFSPTIREGSNWSKVVIAGGITDSISTTRKDLDSQQRRIWTVEGRNRLKAIGSGNQGVRGKWWWWRVYLQFVKMVQTNQVYWRCRAEEDQG